MKHLFLLCLGLLIIPSLRAESSGAKHVVPELWSEIESIVPGETFDVGLHLKADKGWHTYWKNPGDSGIPTSIEWTLPAGFIAGPLQWTIPERIEAQPLVSYGYSGETLFPIRITSHADAKVGTTITLKAQVKWLECREVCIPGKRELTISLPVSSEKAKPSKHAAEFEAAHAKVPMESDAWTAKFEISGERLILAVESRDGKAMPSGTFTYFPTNKGEIKNSAPQPFERDGGKLRLTLTTSELLSETPAKMEGILVSSKGWTGGGEEAIAVRGNVVPGTPGASGSAAPAIVDNPFAQASLIQMLLFALLGGLILNLMPCVFPVLSIKILSFVEQAQKKSAVIRRHGLVFTFGVLTSFWALAGTLIALRAGGQQLGWGFQLQSPAFLVFLAVLMFLLGLNLLGVFEIGNSLMGVGQKLTSSSGYAGSFFTGVLATIVATPCTAPFMGSAVGFALTQSAFRSLLIFTALGLGMALPYLILSCFPALLKKLPRPGRWMETLKQFMAFPLFATVIWLVWVFGFQTGIDGVMQLLIALLILSVATWVLQRWGSLSAGVRQRWIARSICAALVLASLYVGARAAKTKNAAAVSLSSEGLTWVPYAKAKLNELRKAQKIVFLDFTAAWCLSCQVNEKLVFSSEEVRHQVANRNVVLMKADWTEGDPEITTLLAQFGRSGVPFYLLYHGEESRAPMVLPELLTPGAFLSALNEIK